jgi:hypothetical protein
MKGSGKLVERRAAVIGLLAGCTALGLATVVCEPKGAELVRQIRRCLRGTAGLTDAAVLARFRAEAEADFRAGRIVHRGGWYLSATEVLLFERLRLF